MNAICAYCGKLKMQCLCGSTLDVSEWEKNNISNVSSKMKKEKRPIEEEFLNDVGEVHALWYGFYSAWFTLDRMELSEELNKDIDENNHYFTAGYFIGRVIKKILTLWLHKKKKRSVMKDK